MKAPIKIEQRNAGDYLASHGIPCTSDEAEFYLVLRENDKIETTMYGLELLRGGKRYLQKDKMSTFRGMAFYEHGADAGGGTIVVKMVSASSGK